MKSKQIFVICRPSYSKCDYCCNDETSSDSIKKPCDALPRADNSELQSVASKWGRDVKVKENENASCPIPTRTTCTCRHDDDACQTCAIAQCISNAKSPAQAEHVIADFVGKGGKLPAETAIEKTAGVEEVKKLSNLHCETCPNVTFHNEHSCESAATTECSLATCKNCKHQYTPSKGLGSYIKSYFGFDSSSSINSCNYSSSALTRASSEANFSPFPSAGTYQNPKCARNVKLHERKNLSIAKQLSLSVNDLSNLKNFDKDAYIKSILQDSPSRPITAKAFRKNSRSMTATNKSKNLQEKTNAVVANSKPFIIPLSDNSRNTSPSMQLEAKIYPSSGMPAPHTPQEYWKKEGDKESQFSKPELKYKDELEYCEECGGEVTLKPAKDLTYTYRYLIHHDKGKPNKSEWFVQFGFHCFYG